MEKKIAHIHEVIEILMSDNKSYSSEEFTNMIQTKFGEDIQFTSCSDNMFDIDEVKSFLLARNKILIEDERILPHPSLAACNH